MELNNAELLRLEGTLPWVQFHDDSDALWLFAGDTWPRNTVALARFTSASAPKRIGEILAPHLAQKVACNWVVGSVSEPADLGKHLRAHGFKCMIHCAGMACDLDKLPAAPRIPAGVRIQLVDDPPPIHPLTTERRRRRHEGHQLLLRKKPRQLWHLEATVKDKPVGQTVIFIGAGVAGIYGVFVLEEFRGRGIGAALVHKALAVSRNELGHRAAVLSATGMGFGVYARVGFREVGKFSFWKYGKMRQQRRTACDVLKQFLVAANSQGV